MIFYSLNNTGLRAHLRNATLNPQAPDGGLYMPLHIPRIPDALYRHLAEFSLHDIAFVVTNQLFGGDIDSTTLQTIVNRTLSFDIPLQQIDDNIWSLELYHGPSQSFKDIGVRFLAQLLNYFREDSSDNTINLLAATAGPALETIVRAFADVEGIKVYILYPAKRSNRISFSLTGCKASNIIPVEIDGTFDDCQSIIKQAFSDNELTSEKTLSSANSLNISRLLPQTLYYFWAYAQLMRNDVAARPLCFSVPSGNFGNLCAGVMAKKMGLPVARFIAAENINCPFNRFLTTGIDTKLPTVATASDALDVGSPSNLPRLLQLYDGDLSLMRSEISSAVVDEQSTLLTIKQLYQTHRCLLDTHSAVAYKALRENLKPDQTGVFLSTASPDKSHNTLTSLLGPEVFPHQKQNITPSEIKPIRINATYPAFKKFLLTQ